MILLLFVLLIAAPPWGGDRCYGRPPGDSLVVVTGLSGATAFCVAPSGTLYVLEEGKDRLTRFSGPGKREAETGGFGWGEGGFDRPSDVTAVDDLELFVADRGNDRIVRLDRTLGLTSVFETRKENVTFRFPLSVALTEFGKLLIVDGENARIVELGKEDRVTRVFGGSGSGASFLKAPTRVRADGHQRVVVGDGDGLAVYDSWGNRLRTIPRTGTGKPIAFDAASGGIALLDSGSVLLLGRDGADAGAVPIPATPGAKVPVDVRWSGDRLCVLYPDRVVCFPAPTLPPEAGRRETGRPPD